MCRIALACAASTLPACAPLEGTQHPFQDVPAPAISDITASPSVMVAPVGGPPPEVGRVLAELVADSLRERDVIAVTRNPAPGSMLLTGHAEVVPEGRDHALLRVAWSLTQADGLTTGTFQSDQTIPVIPGEDPYQRLSASAFVPFASRVAFKVADQIQHPPKPVQVASAADTLPESPSPAAEPAPPTEAKSPKPGAKSAPAQSAKSERDSHAALRHPPEKAAAALTPPPAAEERPPADTEAASPDRPAPAAKPEVTAEAEQAPAPSPVSGPAPTPAAKPEPTPAAKPVEPTPLKMAQAEAPAAEPAVPPAPKPAAEAAPVAAPAATPAQAADLQAAALKAAMSRSERRKAARQQKQEEKQQAQATAEPSAPSLIGTQEAIGASGPATPPASSASAPSASTTAAPAQSAMPTSTQASPAAPQTNPTAPPPQPVRVAEAVPTPLTHSAPEMKMAPASAAPAAAQGASTPPAAVPVPSATPASGQSEPTAAPANPTPPSQQTAALSQPVQPSPPPPAPSPAPRPTPAAAPANPAPVPERTAALSEPVQPSPRPPAPAARPAPAPAPSSSAASAPPATPAAPAAAPVAPPSQPPANPAAPAPVGRVDAVMAAPVQGAPGNGNRALTDAIKQALTRSGLRISDYAGPGTLVLHGRVTADPVGPETDNVVIEWALYDAAGHFLGTVTQRNQLPHSLSQGRWDSTAPLAAQGAVAGIRSLIAQAAAPR